jgi:hypothetical protein
VMCFEAHFYTDDDMDGYKAVLPHFFGTSSGLLYFTALTSG